MSLLIYSNVFVLIFVLINSQGTSDCDNKEIQQLCLDQETCGDCLQAHACCNYCYDEDYKGRKCNIRSNLKECADSTIEKNSDAEMELLLNQDFTAVDKNAAPDKIIQIKPQHIRLKLRKGIPFNFTFTYNPAKDYPLDLYYLGDLSLSMSKNVEVFKSLGKYLPGNLTQLTKNYRLAYGSFVDKPGMPFYFTDVESYNNPCHKELNTCEKGYSFRHRMDFTKDTNKFMKQVETSNLTANVDDLDGALDAIFQILSCDEKIGFSKHSRKIILLPTDSLLHTAGDGVLVGATLRLNGTCRLDENGEYSDSLLYDYPSLEDIDLLLKQKKVSIIFAVKTTTKLYYYMNMTKDSLKGYAFVAELEEESKNILDLVQKGYYSLAEQVNFYINTTHFEHMDIKFFGDCKNLNIFNETSTCYHVKDQPVRFTVQLTVKEIPSRRYFDTLFVEEKNINEKLELSIEYLGKCNCTNIKVKREAECMHGEMNCGKCKCHKEWGGEQCSLECSHFETNLCRDYDENNNPSRICYGNGECVCGKCLCESTYSGKYCQFQCPYKRKGSDIVICGGPLKGHCLNGTCLCEENFIGEDCSCSRLTTECIFYGGSICSGNGECICNECKCTEKYTGKYCEQNELEENNTICQHYASVIKNYYAKENETKTIKNNRIKVIDESGNEELSCDDFMKLCKTEISEGKNNCIMEYCYYQTDNKVHLPARKICWMTAGFKNIIFGAVVAAAILALGLIGIVSYKINIRRQEVAEYKKFAAAAKNIHEMNPIYRSPVTEYRNPLRAKND